MRVNLKHQNALMMWHRVLIASFMHTQKKINTQIQYQ